SSSNVASISFAAPQICAANDTDVSLATWRTPMSSSPTAPCVAVTSASTSVTAPTSPATSIVLIVSAPASGPIAALGEAQTVVMQVSKSRSVPSQVSTPSWSLLPQL